MRLRLTKRRRSRAVELPCFSCPVSSSAPRVGSRYRHVLGVPSPPRRLPGCERARQSLGDRWDPVAATFLASRSMSVHLRWISSPWRAGCTRRRGKTGRSRHGPAALPNGGQPAAVDLSGLSNFFRLPAQ